MPTYPQILAGRSVTAALLDAMIPNVVTKAATQTVNNSTTLVNDDSLFVPVEAGGVYEVTAWIVHSSQTAGDIAIGWSGPSGSTMTWGVQGPAASATAASDSAANFQQRSISQTAGLGGGAGTAVCTDARGVLTVGSMSGLLRMRWAQNTANASDTQVLGGSHLRVKRIA
ncbi:hypothetical protein E6R18_15825 [Streptomyces sp. A1277]|uniref:hypothetical protein n=1 Tax=Streptomyces sp. A1277 TaxID=2563103 RepID=UPI0010A235B3|nr:hypothetical protein [Streptomyces sp. A1277]THA31797.1 hypothetical protein E6R18_15825 [Streptomyces sp. A1277]